MIGWLLLVCLNLVWASGGKLLTWISGLDTTATELSVVESVFRLGEGAPGAINTTNKDAMVESFY